MKVVVCGTRFGQFYLEAVKKRSDVFELAGILAGGSERSRKCAEYYGVPLYRSVDELPDDIDLACVVIGSSVFGKSGTDIAKKLIERKINVIQEQPVHQKDIQDCYRLAVKNKVIYSVGDLYVYMEQISAMMKAVKTAVSHSEILMVEMTCASQVLFPAIHILTKMFADSGYITSVDILGKTGPFSSVNIKIGNIMVLLKVYNRTDRLADDQNMLLLHNITVWTDQGSIILSDDYGDILWKNPLVMPDRKDIPRGLADDAPDELDKLPIETIKESRDATLAQQLSELWTDAIGTELAELADIIKGDAPRQGYDMGMQQLLICANKWKAVTDAIGYPESAVTDPTHNLSAFELKKAVLADKAPTKADIEEALEKMDIACLETMMWAYSSKGLFADKNIGHSKEEICKSSGALEQHYKLMGIWLDNLVHYGYIEYRDGMYYPLVIRKDDRNYHKSWREAKFYWEQYLGPVSVYEYFRDNAEKIHSLMDGSQNPTLLLFKEGRMELANDLYMGTTVAKFMNSSAAENLRMWINEKNVEKLRVLELGAGTGATTHSILKELDGVGDKEYVFTDLSQYFLGQAKKNFSEYDYIRYELFDIDRQFAEQGADAESFDAIIAIGVINNAKDTYKTMKAIIDTLKKGGIFLMVEAVRESLEIMISQSFMMTAPEDVRDEKGQVFYTQNDWEELFNRFDNITWKAIPDADAPQSALGQALFVIRKEEM